MREKPFVIYSGQPKHCDRCGAHIGFTQNRKGKWYAINLFVLPSGKFAYYSGYGNHGNATDFHSCDIHVEGYPCYAEYWELNHFDQACYQRWYNMYIATSEQSEEDFNMLPEWFKSELAWMRDC
jgi:hypothetical protein